MNDLQKMIVDAAVEVWEQGFSDLISLEEFQLCLEAQYSPGEFIIAVEDKTAG